jgi:hypothetical protein
MYFVKFSTFGCRVTLLGFSVAWVVKEGISLKNDKNGRKIECIEEERKEGGGQDREKPINRRLIFFRFVTKHFLNKP